MPSHKAPGDKLIGGTVNGNGSLVMRADTVGAGTVLSRIVAMVSAAQRSRAPIQRMADTVSGYFVPAVLGIAICRLHRLGDLGACARAGLCPDRSRLGRHHRMPVRTGIGDADVDHGRGR
jgi:hypothetical protein